MGNEANLNRFTFGRLYDAIGYHGDVPNRVVEASLAVWGAAKGPSCRVHESKHSTAAGMTRGVRLAQAYR